MAGVVAGLVATVCVVAPVFGFGAPAGSASPSKDMTNALLGVSCPTATACNAVGATYIGPNAPIADPAQPFAGRWNAKSFSVVTSPSPAGATNSGLVDVSCTRAGICFGVGFSSAATKRGAALVERWNGKSWSIVANPQLAYSTLNGVSCTSTTFCMAVGQGSSGTGALVERWNGKKWSVVASPRTSGEPAELEGVSCTSTTHCWAVGDYSSAAASEALPLLERWNGTTWSIVRSPNPAGPNPRLTDVSCASATSCLAVGSMDTGLIDSSAPWVERWNGKTWTLVAAAASTARSAALKQLSCTGPSSCFAVGSFDNSTNATSPRPLVERWNGKAWTMVAPAPTASGMGGWFNNVSCTSPSACLAVGASVTLIQHGFYRQKTLVESWNGKSWSTVASP